MNITDVTEEFKIPESNYQKLKDIFERQEVLMHKYHDIESRNGFHIGDGFPLNLDNKHDQYRLKDFAWRIVEEVGEALEAFEKQDIVHYYEELIDGLHFLVELCILSGINHDNLKLVESEEYLYRGHKLEIVLAKFIRYLGTTMNHLKNKPWKNTHMITDSDSFKIELQEAWRWYNILMVKSGLKLDDIYLIYFKKSEVNKFRQRSNY